MLYLESYFSLRVPLFKPIFPPLSKRLAAVSRTLEPNDERLLRGGKIDWPEDDELVDDEEDDEDEDEDESAGGGPSHVPPVMGGCCAVYACICVKWAEREKKLHYLAHRHSRHLTHLHHPRPAWRLLPPLSSLKTPRQQLVLSVESVCKVKHTAETPWGTKKAYWYLSLARVYPIVLWMWSSPTTLHNLYGH